MKKQILIVVAAMIFLGVAGGPRLLSAGPASPNESKSVGTQAGETARDVKNQFEEVLQKL